MSRLISAIISRDLPNINAHLPTRWLVHQIMTFMNVREEALWASVCKRFYVVHYNKWRPMLSQFSVLCAMGSDTMKLWLRNLVADYEHTCQNDLRRYVRQELCRQVSVEEQKELYGQERSYKRARLTAIKRCGNRPQEFDELSD